ncbi:11051_t:CDS:1, partial [Acaulospora colombiana]
AFTHIGWGPPIATRWGLEETFLGPEPPSEEREIDLPDAPEYQTSFTHPGKAIPGFTSEFAPLEIIDLDSDDEYDPLFDDDPRPRKKKGKEKAITPKTLKTVCAMCKDPLVMGATTEDRRNYALRCGHIVDGKCLWNIAKPAGAQASETMEAE